MLGGIKRRIGLAKRCRRIQPELFETWFRRAALVELREDVVAVARSRESGVTIKQIATDFGISEATLQKWLRQADVEDGNRPGQTAADAAEARELKKRIRLLEQENEVLRRAEAYLSQANLRLGGSPK